MNQNLSDAEIAQVKSILSRQLEVDRDQITLDANIMGDLGADSLDVAEIIMALEERYDITIADEIAEKATTVGDLCEALAELLPERHR